MGSTFQSLIVLHALRQCGVSVRALDAAALHVFHLGKIRDSLQQADRDPANTYFAKSHVAHPRQVEAVMSARNSRIFLVWRNQQDSLCSDFHFAQRHAGHIYADFNDYFCRRGRKVLLRNCLQKVAWDCVHDPRVRAWGYLELVRDFEAKAAQMLDFAGLHNVDIKALEKSVSLGALRAAHGDGAGRFFRQGGTHDLDSLGPSAAVLRQIAEVEQESDWRVLARAYERENVFRALVFGCETREAGLRKTFHWWLSRVQAESRLSRWLRLLYLASPSRLRWFTRNGRRLFARQER